MTSVSSWICSCNPPMSCHVVVGFSMRRKLSTSKFLVASTFWRIVSDFCSTRTVSPGERGTPPEMLT